MAGSENSVNENDAETSRDSLNEKDTAASRNAGKGKAKTTTVHFTYDGDGVRTEKSVTSQSKTDATQYLWDINHGLPQVLTESDKKGTALYSYGLGRISMADPKKGSMYYQYDGLGSVRSLTDRKGMTKALYYYDVFGNPLITASTVDNDFQYTGEQVDDETGLIYLRARYYDPEIGRFISRDPFTGFDTAPQSLNRYTYVQNNPVVYTDPSGKVAWYIPGLFSAAANTGWYIGEQIGTQYKTGHNQFSIATLGGRAAGGFAAGTAASIAFARTGNPYLMGAAAGGAGYAADRLTQEQLSNFGLGKAEPRSWEGLALATGAGTVMGPVTNKIIPFSPENTGLQRVAQNVIFRSGAGSMNVGYNAAPNAYNAAINSCQGPPVRMGGGSIYLPGQKLN